MQIMNGWDLSLAESRLEKLETAIDEIFTIRGEQGYPEWSATQETEQLRDIADELKSAINKYKKQQVTEFKQIRVELKKLPLFLTQRRIAIGMTQQQLADKLGITVTSITKYENGNYCKASLKRIIEIAEALGAEI